MLNTTLDTMPYSPAQLEAIFREILHTRMQGLPIINTQLDVQAIDFQAWEDYYLGMMITPWFMNLLWIADTAETFVSGNTRLLSLPSGEYALNANHAAAVGTFYSASLFSPVLQFADHTTAVLTAQHIMLAIMDAGTQQAHNTATTLPAKPAVSRRDFLRGKFA